MAQVDEVDVNDKFLNWYTGLSQIDLPSYSSYTVDNYEYQWQSLYVVSLFKYLSLKVK